MPTSAERIETAEMQELQQRLAELESQNQQLQEMLGYVQSRPTEGITAPIIGRSADHWWQQVTLSRGSRDGIQVGGIVAGPGGLVGRITHVTPSTSRVLLVSDPTSQVGVTISRSRHMGYMRGQAANRAVMEFFDKVPDVQPGDVVSTSSFSQLFPPGFPIGRVESVNLSKSPAPEAVIELSAPINALEWVVVYPNSRTEIPNSP
jgi:rod shape-determining protein MreC